MTKIVLELDSCRKCPHHYSSPYPTSDSFERPEYFWCTNSDVEKENPGEDPEDENRRVFIKNDHKLMKLSYVAGYVEWRDKEPIPKWCPLRIKE